MQTEKQAIHYNNVETTAYKLDRVGVGSEHIVDAEHDHQVR